MIIKKRYKLTAIILFFFFIATLISAAPNAEIKQPVVQSKAIVLVDQRSGKVLWEQNADQRRPIASTTKIMTALLVLEKLGISENVTFSETASAVGGSKFAYKPGEQRSAEELLYSLMLLSANNAATALAEKVGGTGENFVNMMNLKAAQIGAVNTVFANPHGLPTNRPQYSTARDLALMATQAMKYPVFRRIAASREHEFSMAGEPPKKLENSNELLKAYRDATGIKTGYTAEAGYCLVASAKRGSLSLVAVILGSKSRSQSFADALELFEYGFNNFSYRHVVVKNRAYARVNISKKSKQKIKLVAEEDLFLLIYDQPASIKYKPEVETKIKLPVHKGKKLGKLVVTQFDQELGQINLLAAADYKKNESKKVKKKQGGGLIDSLKAILGLT